jgi:hypothetical protein
MNRRLPHFSSRHGTPQYLTERFLKARRDHWRERMTAVRGLQLSFMMALLVGWMLLGSNPKLADTAAGGQCEQIGLPVGPAAQARLRAAAGAPAQANAARQRLAVRVCDPNMAAMLRSPEVRTELKGMKGLRGEVAGFLGESKEDVSLSSLWKEIVAVGGAGH